MYLLLTKVSNNILKILFDKNNLNEYRIDVIFFASALSPELSVTKGQRTTCRRGKVAEHARACALFKMGNNFTANMQYVMLKTQRNNEKILHNGHFYIKDYCNNSCQYWRCATRKCKGRLITTPLDNISHIEMKGSHNHIISEEEIKKANFCQKVKTLAENTHYATSKVFSLASNFTNIHDLPTIPKNSVYKNIRTIRKKNNIYIDTDVDLSESNITTDRGEAFCVYDSGNKSESRIIIFTTETNVTHLKNSYVWLLDGTFKVVPKEFYQLYIIHGKIFGKIFPLLYILMSNKTQFDYENLLSILKNKIELQLPGNIIINFEIAAYNAFKKASTKCNVYFCLFHLGQCLWRKIQKLGLSKLYFENSNFRLYMKCFSSLAFVPTEYIEQEFEKLKQRASEYESDKLSEFIIYFEKNFIRSMKYPLFSWNANQRLNNNVELTTNAAESFHSHFYSRFEQSHSGLQTFIEKLKETQSLVEQNINYILCNPNLGKKSKYAIKIENIKAICENYHGYYSTFFLESISKTYNWKFD